MNLLKAISAVLGVSRGTEESISSFRLRQLKLLIGVVETRREMARPPVKEPVQMLDVSCQAEWLVAARVAWLARFSLPEVATDDGLVHRLVFLPGLTDVPATFSCLQLEQLMSSRWMSRGYLKQLASAEYVFDFKDEHLRFLRSLGFSLKRLRRIQVDASLALRQELGGVAGSMAIEERIQAALFYGSTDSNRRRQILRQVEQVVPTTVLEGVPRDELIHQIRQHAFVVNIHDSPGNLLEDLRISECLALGTPVVTENSYDMASHRLKNLLVVQDMDDENSLRAALTHLLHPGHWWEMRLAIENYVSPYGQ